MVSPRDGWDDREEGYRRDDVGVFVEPTVVDGEDARRVTEYDAANAFTVSLCREMGTEAETRTPLVRFDEPRTAWEYAHLVTHYVSASFDPSFAESELTGTDGHDPDRWRPEGVVSDLDAETVLRKTVDHHVHKVEDVLEGDAPEQD
ncbi:hypothetical protein [Halopiger goleimassiliensis]|uniref:hypothetical protein n=1 Tax=Halopiger goleimassiliensis TaxID=1293048 RepID=UPI000677E944|nr:hypothetical protein [Halopiger goleimassiliensis]